MSIINDKDYLAKCENYYLKPGYIYVSQEPTVITTVLGSCIAVCMYDTIKKYGGMNHFVMPSVSKTKQATSFYGDASIMALCKTFTEFGSNQKDLVAQIVGGAYLDGSKNSKIVSEDNISVTKSILKKLRIPIISEDTGGIVGRKIIYSSEHNELLIAKIKVRDTDFIIKL